MNTPASTVHVFGYVRVSTTEQAFSGAGIGAQTAAIRRECDHRGWVLVDVIADEGRTGKTLDRPGLMSALERIVGGEADGLVASKLDRLSRSVVGFSTLLQWFQDADATLVVLDPALDTSTPSGRLTANVFASVAEWEADVIADRTRDGLKAIRASGRPISRPAVADRPELAARVLSMREDGMTYQAIADALNAEGVPTLRGGSEWRVSSVQSAAGYQRRPRRRTPVDLPQSRRRGRASGRDKASTPRTAA